MNSIGWPKPTTRSAQTEVMVPRPPKTMSPVDSVATRLPPATMSADVGLFAAVACPAAVTWELR